MELLISGVTLVMKRKDSRRVIVGCTVFLLLVLLAIQNGRDALSAISFNFLPIGERIILAFKTFFDIKDTFTGGTLILAILGSFLGGINFSLAYTYTRLRGAIILDRDIHGGVGVFLAFLGIGYVVCGIALLSAILGFFGFSAMLNFLSYQGQEFGYIGLIILLIATYTLARKVAGPNLC